MPTNEFLKESLEHFKKQRHAKLEELRSLDITIRQIQQQMGEVPDQQSDPIFAQVSLAETKSANTEKPAGTYKPRADEFFGMSQAAAAKSFLEKVGHAVLLDEILAALKNGSCKVGGADPKKTLYIALIQNARDFVATGNGHIGLRQFYPNMPKIGRPKATGPGKNTSAKRRANKSAKRKVKPKATTAKPKAHDPAELTAAVSEALNDYKLKSPEEVLKAVERTVGHPVKKIAVYGMLRKKDFEQVGDKYRLRQPTEGIQVVQ